MDYVVTTICIAEPVEVIPPPLSVYMCAYYPCILQNAGSTIITTTCSIHTLSCQVNGTTLQCC